VGPIWERDVLPLRMAHYQPQELEALCQEGELVWVGSGGVDPRRGRFRFLFRGEGSTYLEPVPEDLSDLSEPAQEIYAFLKSEGALFLTDICAALDLQSAPAEAALAELAMAGLVTNDSLAVMRKMIGQGAPRTGPQKPYSSLEAQLAQRRGKRGTSSQRSASSRRGFGKPGPAQYRSAKRRVRQRLAQVAPVQPTSQGRWTLVHRFGVLGKAVGVEERIARQARQLLARYGVVTYESLAQEYGSWEWRLIYRQLQRLEMRGEVRRGYFCQGRSGVQFALPDVVDRLREVRDNVEGDETLVVLNACDPANLYGPARDDGPRTVHGEPLAFSRLLSTWVVQHRGWPVLVASGGGAHLVSAQGADEGLIRRALQALLDHRGVAARSVSVETWNGDPVLESDGQPLLEAVGFYRNYPQMVWDRRP